MTPPTGKEPARLRADALPCAAARERDDRARLAFVGCAIALLLSIAIGARKAIIPMIVSVALVAAILLGLYVALLVVAG